MPRGDKSKYTAEQERKAEHIEQSYEARGVSATEATSRAWATVNKQSGGGEKAGGSGARTSASAKSAARRDSARRASTSRQGGASKTQRAVTRSGKSVELEQLRMDELRKRASAEGIPGRSGMRKQQLIDALRTA